jgi:hypothetical protein
MEQPCGRRMKNMLPFWSDQRGEHRPAAARLQAHYGEEGQASKARSSFVLLFHFPCVLNSVHVPVIFQEK